MPQGGGLGRNPLRSSHQKGLDSRLVSTPLRETTFQALMMSCFWALSTQTRSPGPTAAQPSETWPLKPTPHQPGGRGHYYLPERVVCFSFTSIYMLLQRVVVLARFPSVSARVSWAAGGDRFQPCHVHAASSVAAPFPQPCFPPIVPDPSDVGRGCCLWLPGYWMGHPNADIYSRAAFLSPSPLRRLSRHPFPSRPPMKRYYLKCAVCAYAHLCLHTDG